MKIWSDVEGLPIYSWVEEVEQEAVNQAHHLAKLPFAFHHIALMPDCHSGYGMPIGTVLATRNVVIPNAVGVDIGCGMLAVRTSELAESFESVHWNHIFGGSAVYPGGIRSSIPTGFNHHSKKQDERWMPEANWPNPDEDDYMETLRICREQYDSALKQVGTLGGGNHFIEFQRDEDGFLWFMIHSGSRNLGHKVATHYNEVAKKLNAKWHSAVPAAWDLAHLPVDSEEGRAYIGEMNYCVAFAMKNRELMAACIKDALIAVFPLIMFPHEVNIAHNYAAIENHFGENVWVHRKGATKALPQVQGIIPGSQGSKSYIVTGTGKHDSFMSCSHGAGRRMGRKAAQRSLNLDEERARLAAAGVVLHSVRNQKDLDEAPGAYKDIDTVMKQQEDLVRIEHTLSPICVMKG